MCLLPIFPTDNLMIMSQDLKNKACRKKRSYELKNISSTVEKSHIHYKSWTQDCYSKVKGSTSISACREFISLDQAYVANSLDVKKSNVS